MELTNAKMLILWKALYLLSQPSSRCAGHTVAGDAQTMAAGGNGHPGPAGSLDDFFNGQRAHQLILRRLPPRPFGASAFHLGVSRHTPTQGLVEGPLAPVEHRLEFDSPRSGNRFWL